jgi:hypothetical protein
MATVAVRDGKYVDRWELKSIDSTHFSMRTEGNTGNFIAFHVGEFRDFKTFYEALVAWLRGGEIDGLEFVREVRG